MNAVASEQALQRLGVLIEERLGLRFHQGNVDFLARGLQRLGAGEPSLADGLYAELLASPLHWPVWQRLIAEVTVGETYFFRHPEDFAVLSRHVVPELVNAGHTQLRAWSAGCATGEEAYSLASCLGTAAPNAAIDVLGTDLNEAGIAYAEKGLYGPRSLRGALPDWESALPVATDGQRQLPGELRRRLRFAVHNLAEPELPGALGSAGCQVIFCRNVLIYFGASRAVQVLRKLAQGLVPGGYLFVSPLDLTHQLAALTPLEIDGVWLFRKAVAAVVAPPKPRVDPPLLLPRVTPPTSQDPVQKARLAADQGDLRTATQMARLAVRSRRTPEALHVLALILGEQNQPEEMRRLLEEAVTQCPSYVQGHLSLGLLPPLGPHKLRAAHHLTTVLSLLEARPDDDILAGPEPLSVTLARRLAQQGLHNLQPSDGGGAR